MEDYDNILVCGCDDSNHSGRGKEIILATFSSIYDDSIFREFENRARGKSIVRRREILEAVREWMEHPERDYRFASIDGSEYNNGSNIPFVFPDILKNYLDGLDRMPDKTRIYIDGHLRKEHKEMILDEFSSLPNLNVYSVIKGKTGKRRSKPKVLWCPSALWAADIWANQLHRLGENYFSNHEKRVILP